MRVGGLGVVDVGDAVDDRDDLGAVPADPEGRQRLGDRLRAARRRRGPARRRPARRARRPARPPGSMPSGERPASRPNARSTSTPSRTPSSPGRRLAEPETDPDRGRGAVAAARPADRVVEADDGHPARQRPRLGRGVGVAIEPCQSRWSSATLSTTPASGRSDGAQCSWKLDSSTASSVGRLDPARRAPGRRCCRTAPRGGRRRSASRAASTSWWSCRWCR